MAKLKLNIALVLMSLMIIVVCVAFWLIRPSYTEGVIPTKDASKYFVYVKDGLFEDWNNKWIDVSNDSKGVVWLYAKDTAKFKEKLLGKDNLAKVTIEKFEGQGYEWKDDDEELGMCFSLPRDFTASERGGDMRAGRYDYVKVPVWLMSVLIDEGVIDLKKEMK